MSANDCCSPGAGAGARTGLLAAAPAALELEGVAGGVERAAEPEAGVEGDVLAARRVGGEEEGGLGVGAGVGEGLVGGRGVGLGVELLGGGGLAATGG